MRESSRVDFLCSLLAVIDPSSHSNPTKLQRPLLAVDAKAVGGARTIGLARAMHQELHKPTLSLFLFFFNFLPLGAPELKASSRPGTALPACLSEVSSTFEDVPLANNVAHNRCQNPMPKSRSLAPAEGDG